MIRRFICWLRGHDLRSNGLLHIETVVIDRYVCARCGWGLL